MPLNSSIKSTIYGKTFIILIGILQGYTIHLFLVLQNLGASCHILDMWVDFSIRVSAVR